MAKRRPSGDGMVRKREDGRWEGRIVVGHKENCDSTFRYIYADTQKELTAKLRQNNDIYQGIDLTEQSRMTLAEWLEQWLGQISTTLRPSTLCGQILRWYFLCRKLRKISCDGLRQCIQRKCTTKLSSLTR